MKHTGGRSKKSCGYDRSSSYKDSAAISKTGAAYVPYTPPLPLVYHATVSHINRLRDMGPGEFNRDNPVRAVMLGIKECRVCRLVSPLPCPPSLSSMLSRTLACACQFHEQTHACLTQCPEGRAWLNAVCANGKPIHLSDVFFLKKKKKRRTGS